MSNDTEAFLRDATAALAGAASVTAENDDQIWAIDGSGNFGGEIGLGAAVSVNVVSDNAYAYIVDSEVSQSSGGLTVSAADQNFGAVDARVIALTASIGASDGFDINGTVSVNNVTDNTLAYLSGTTYTDTASGQPAMVTARDSSGILSIAGAVALALTGDLGFGAAGSYNIVHDTSRAYLEGSKVILQGDLTVAALSTSVIGSLTAGGAGSAGTTLAGSVSINMITDTIDAHISQAATADPNSTTGNVSSVQTSGNVVLSATDTSVLVSLAGGIAVSETEAAIGAAVSYNLIQNTLTAYVDSSTVTSTAGGVSVSAGSTPVLVSLAIGGAGGELFAFGGSVTVNSIDNTVSAYVTSSTVTAWDSVGVTATESPVMVVLAGGFAGSANAAVGAAVAVNMIGGSFDQSNPDAVATAEEASSPPSEGSDQVGAYIENSTVTATNGDVTVLAGYQKPSALPGSSVSLLSAGTITLPVPVSQALVSIAIGATGGDSFALGGSVNVNLMRGSAAAYITSTGTANSVTAGGAVVVAANDVGAIGSAAGGLALAGAGPAIGSGGLVQRCGQSGHGTDRGCERPLKRGPGDRPRGFLHRQPDDRRLGRRGIRPGRVGVDQPDPRTPSKHTSPTPRSRVPETSRSRPATRR